MEEAISSLRWVLAGAVVGALLLGGFGLLEFGLMGLAIGAGGGAVLGAVGAWLFYLSASSIS